MMSKDVYQDAVVDAEKQRIKLGLDKIPRRNDMKKQV
jgi:hypothetical protein